MHRTNTPRNPHRPRGRREPLTLARALAAESRLRLAILDPHAAPWLVAYAERKVAELVEELDGEVVAIGNLDRLAP